MSASKFFIYGGGRWREVEDDGRVAGWAGSTFVYLKRGKLCIANRKAVIKGLKDLANGRPSAVKVGIPLLQAKNEDLYEGGNLKAIQHGKCNCCHNNVISCDTDANFNRLQKPSTNTVAIQCSPAKHTSTQVLYTQNNREAQKIDIIHDTLPESRRETRSQHYCKELLIDETDVMLFRAFLENDTKNTFNVDLLRYDQDDDYKKLVFYKINPLVNVVRDKTIQRILNGNEMQQIEFAQILGLRSINDPMFHRRLSKRKRVHEDKENDINKIRKLDTGPIRLYDRGDRMEVPLKLSQHKQGMLAKFREDRLRNVSDNSGSKAQNGDLINGNSISNFKKLSGDSTHSKGKIKKPMRKWIGNYSKTGRDYSRLEDDAIVTWILKNDKANFVNGNKLWRTLQPIHEMNTGQFRTWHSLRNRYLRYILPSLGAMSLPQAQVTSLRAAASTGELKARKVQRRNSIFKTTKVKSAWTAKPPPKPREDDEIATPKPCRSDTTTSPVRNKLPTYSEITRRFALRHRSTPNSIDSDRQSSKNMKIDKQSPKNTKNDHDSQKITKINEKSSKTTKPDQKSQRITKSNRQSPENAKNNRQKEIMETKEAEITIEIKDSDEETDDDGNRRISSGPVNESKSPRKVERNKRGRYIKAKRVKSQNSTFKTKIKKANTLKEKIVKENRRRSKRLNDTEHDNEEPEKSIEVSRRNESGELDKKNSRTEDSRSDPTSSAEKLKLQKNARKIRSSKRFKDSKEKQKIDSLESDNSPISSPMHQPEPDDSEDSNQTEKTRKNSVRNSNVDKNKKEHRSIGDSTSKGERKLKRSQKKTKNEHKRKTKESSGTNSNSIEGRNTKHTDKAYRQQKEKTNRQKNKLNHDMEDARSKDSHIQYESDLTDFEISDQTRDSSSASTSSPKSPAKSRIQFEEDTSSSESNVPRTGRQTRLSKILAEKSSQNADNDRQRRTRRLFNPTAFYK